MRYLLLLGLLTACSSEPDSEPVDCNIEDVDGLYYFEWTPTDGNCDIDDGPREFDLGPSDGCTYSADVDGCSVSAVEECAGDVVLTSVTEQLTDDGSKIKGTLTISDPAECSGTLRFEAERQ